MFRKDASISLSAVYVQPCSCGLPFTRRTFIISNSFIKNGAPARLFGFLSAALLLYILLYFIEAPSLRASSSSGLPSMSPTAMTPLQSTFPQSFQPMCPIRRSYQ